MQKVLHVAPLALHQREPVADAVVIPAKHFAGLHDSPS